jgi:hypothetical protein
MTQPSSLLLALELLDAAHPTARKRLIGPDVNFGRELLVTLARRTGGWVGWEASNLRGAAQDLAFLPLANAGIRVGNDVAIGALVNQALDREIGRGMVDKKFAALAPGLGFRRALLDTLLEIRTAGITADELRSGVAAGSPAYSLPAILCEYERLLAEAQLADPPAVFQMAIDAFDREAPFALDAVIALVDDGPARGLPGRLRELLLAGGAQVLARDEPKVGSVFSDGVSVDFFAAATPSEELREVCRRVLAEGLRWDDVEIVAMDPDVYGIAFDALCQQIELSATMLQGIPLSRTRLGRALDRWLCWLGDGLSADVLRQALEAGELDVSNDGVASTAVARELRSLRIGWGRDRYESAITQLSAGSIIAGMTQRDDETEEEFERRRASRARSCDALANLLQKLIATTPPVPERGAISAVPSSSAALATATLGYLALCPARGQSEMRTMERLRGRLESLSRVHSEDVGFSSALAALRESLADLRAWPLITSERKPWSSAGGMPHLTTTSHAGTTGRSRTFVVGFDADRTSGLGRQDPLLPDGARRSIGTGRLVTSIERRDDSAHALSRGLVSLRGRVTLSYATSGTLDGREAGPSPLVLDAWRHLRGEAGLSYEDLRGALRPHVSSVPMRDDSGALAGVVPLDERDVWLDALAEGPLLLDGTSGIRMAFPVLASGLDAHLLANGDTLTAFHGIVPDAGPLLDPAAHPEREISASSLEMLAKCPLSWFYRYGLSLYAREDPEYDESRWLDALDRGTLLHEVFEAFTREFHGRQDEISSPEARRRMLAIAEASIARWRTDVPPPALTVFEVERAELSQASLAFLRMEIDRRAAGDRGEWLSFELAFGRGNARGPFTLPDGRVLLTHGRADRIDQMPDGTLRVIDYKTGKPSFYAKSAKTGAFRGGRQLQPSIYLSAVSALTDKLTSSFEYRFPTTRGGNEIVSYSSDELSNVSGIVSSLLQHVQAGEFIPTTDAGDCGYCSYQEICRASRGRHATGSPRAEWASEHAALLPEFASMLARRMPVGT